MNLYKLNNKGFELKATIDFIEETTDKFEIELHGEVDGEIIEFEKIQD